MRAPVPGARAGSSGAACPHAPQGLLIPPGREQLLPAQRTSLCRCSSQGTGEQAVWGGGPQAWSRPRGLGGPQSWSRPLAALLEDTLALDSHLHRVGTRTASGLQGRCNANPERPHLGGGRRGRPQPGLSPRAPRGARRRVSGAQTQSVRGEHRAAQGLLPRRAPRRAPASCRARCAEPHVRKHKQAFVYCVYLANDFGSGRNPSGDISTNW